MNQIQILTARLAGLKSEGEKLRAKQELFIEASGIEKQVAKSQAEITTLETDNAADKEKLAELNAKKTEAVTGTMKSMQEVMAEVVPTESGTAIITIEDGKVIMGLIPPGEGLTPYSGLSGGEKVVYDGALIHALTKDAVNKILCYECAELDENRFLAFLKHLESMNAGAQLIVNSCHKPKSIPKGWDAVKL